MSVLEHALEAVFAYLRYSHQRLCEIGHSEGGCKLRMGSPAVVRLKVEDELALIRHSLTFADDKTEASS